MQENITQEELKRYEELQIMALEFARRGKTKELESMLDAGLEVNLSDHKGNSLLMLASYNGNLETTKMLISKNAVVDRKNDKGQTPLAGVCFKGYLEIAKVLVENGANIHENNGMGTTPLMFASIFGHSDIVKYLSLQTTQKSFKTKLYLAFSKFIALFRKRD